MKFQTVQSSAFKTIFDVLKDILNDFNIVFTKEGLHILSMDSVRVSIVEVNLAASEFEEYVCEEDVSVGVNANQLFKLLKPTATNDVLRISLTESHTLEILINKSDSKTTTRWNYRLLDVNLDNYVIPDLTPVAVWSTNSADLQKACRDLSHVGTELVITREPGLISFMVNNSDFSPGGLTHDIENDEYTGDRLQDTFLLKYINLFLKAQAMSINCNIYHFGAGMPLLIEYFVASLGKLKFYLAPKISD